MMLIASIVVFFLLMYAHFRYSRRRMYELASKIPGMDTLPVIGNAHHFAGNTAHILKVVQRVTTRAYSQDGICKVWLGPLLYLLILNPADAEVVLSSCLTKDKVYRFMRPWLGDGLIAAPVPIWKAHRKTIMPAFNQKILDSFIDVFNEQSAILVQKLSARIGTAPFDIFQYVSPSTLDIVCETAMGVKINAQANSDSPYIQSSIREMNIIYRRMFQIWLQPQFLFNMTQYARMEKENIKIIHAFTDEVVKKKRRAFEENKLFEASHQGNEVEYKDEGAPTRKAFLELMIELSEKTDRFSDQELRGEVNTMIIAGNDTSALAVSFVLVALGANPHVQEKAYQEIIEVLGDSMRPVTKQDLPKLDYLDRVIKETLRLYPVVPIVVRHLDKDVKLEKHTLPAGSGVVVSIWGMHRDKTVWGADAEEFDPDRFLPENSAKRHPCSFMPFSHGVRNCIGRQYAMMSVKTLLSTLLRSYRFKADSNIDLKAEVLLRPSTGHFVTLEAR